MKKQPKKDKRINSKDFFESCYLRHQYVKRVKVKPTIEEMAPYNRIVHQFASSTYTVYKSLFMWVGLDLEDVESAAQVQLVSYLGLFALEKNPKKLKDFKRLFRKNNSKICKPNDILDKNKANFTCFLKQRMQDLVRVCRQKARNVTGLIAEDFAVFKGDKCPPMDIEDLLENYSKYGFRPLAVGAFKALKKKIKDKQEGPVYLVNDIWYVCVPIKKRNLALTDLVSHGSNPADLLHNMNPEDFVAHAQNENVIQDRSEHFKTLSDKEKKKIVKKFLIENRENSFFEEEVAIARKYLGESNG